MKTETKKTEIKTTDTDGQAEGITEGIVKPPGSARRVIVTIALVIALPACGVLAAWALIAASPEPPKSTLAALAPLVETVPITLEDVDEVFIGYGSARADQRTTLAAEVSGPIVEIPIGVKDGSQVDAGQILVRIDDRQYVQQLERAGSRLADMNAQLQQLDVEKENIEKLIAIVETEVQVTHDEYKRLTDLYEKKVATKKEWDFSRLAYRKSFREMQSLRNQVSMIEPRRLARLASRDALSAEVALAELDVERCAIRSPFRGQVEKISVEVGDQVQRGGRICGIVNPRHIEIPLELPTAVRSRVKKGAKCLLEMDSMIGVRWHAAIARISPDADTRSRTFTVYLEVDNAEQETPLVPGFFLTAKVSGPTLNSVVAIPRRVIIGDTVLVADGSHASVHPIQVDRFVGERAVVSEGLAPTDRLILTNLDVLYDGAAIRWAGMPTSQPVDESRELVRESSDLGGEHP